MQNDASSVYGSRVRPQQGATGAAEMEIEDESDRNLEQDLSAADGFGEHMDLIPSMLTARATKMFTGGAGGARASGEPAVATFVTPWLIKLAKETVSQLFDLHREDVQSSWGEPIDREEATGYLVMDALGIEILPDETRKLGKKAVKTVYEPKRGVKAKDESIKSAAAAKRAKARRAAERSDERRAGLQQKLAEIDAQRDADRAALWSEELDWQLPEGPLVSPPAGTQSVDPAAAAAAADDAELAAAEAAIKAAEVADAAAAQALADAERAARASLSMIPALGVPGCTSPLELLTWIVQQQEEHEARDEWPNPKLYGKACELWTVVEPLVDAVDRAMSKKMDTAHDVTGAKRARLAAVERAHEGGAGGGGATGGSRDQAVAGGEGTARGSGGRE